MKKMTFNVPAMYADHHVLSVRSALSQLSGVQEIIASAARKKVTVDYDEGIITPEKIEETLIQAGYALDQPLPLTKFPKRSEDGSEWYTLVNRVTKTEMKDLEMSGDFRRY
jgi:copper chaperone CopZ